jgi:hypothetical protein
MFEFTVEEWRKRTKVRMCDLDAQIGLWDFIILSRTAQDFLLTASPIRTWRIRQDPGILCARD